jgi:hypothetical protein
MISPYLGFFPSIRPTVADVRSTARWKEDHVKAIILILVITAVVTLGLLAVSVMLLIGMHTEGSHMSPSNAPRTRAGSAARRILGAYVRQSEEAPSTYDDARR